MQSLGLTTNHLSFMGAVVLHNPKLVQFYGGAAPEAIERLSESLQGGQYPEQLRSLAGEYQRRFISGAFSLGLTRFKDPKSSVPSDDPEMFREKLLELSNSSDPTRIRAALQEGFEPTVEKIEIAVDLLLNELGRVFNPSDEREVLMTYLSKIEEHAAIHSDDDRAIMLMWRIKELIDQISEKQLSKVLQNIVSLMIEKYRFPDAAAQAILERVNRIFPDADHYAAGIMLDEILKLDGFTPSVVIPTSRVLDNIGEGERALNAINRVRNEPMTPLEKLLQRVVEASIGLKNKNGALIEKARKGLLHELKLSSRSLLGDRGDMLDKDESGYDHAKSTHFAENEKSEGRMLWYEGAMLVAECYKAIWADKLSRAFSMMLSRNHATSLTAEDLEEYLYQEVREVGVEVFALLVHADQYLRGWILEQAEDDKSVLYNWQQRMRENINTWMNEEGKAYPKLIDDVLQNVSVLHTKGDQLPNIFSLMQ
ncbi:MAG: hypothetical protein ABIE74_10880 [Pseudomonadota bacterium]